MPRLSDARDAQLDEQQKHFECCGTGSPRVCGWASMDLPCSRDADVLALIAELREHRRVELLLAKWGEAHLRDLERPSHEGLAEMMRTRADVCAAALAIAERSREEKP